MVHLVLMSCFIKAAHATVFLDIPHRPGHREKHSFPLCSEQGEGILLTCDSVSMFNQGQRAAENINSLQKKK